MHRLVVKKHRPFQIILGFLLSSIVFAMFIWFLLDATHWRFIKNRFTQSEKTDFLWQANQALEKDNKMLKEEIITFESISQIDKQTAINLQNNIRSLQDQIYRLKRELDFYHGIMAAAKDFGGLNVQGLHIVSTQRERLFRFKLVLTNIVKSDEAAKAVVNMSIEGEYGTQPQVLSLEELAIGQPIERDITVKNFKQIEGNILFPTGFKPLRVVVDLQQQGIHKPTTINKVFEWPVIKS